MGQLEYPLSTATLKRPGLQLKKAGTSSIQRMLTADFPLPEKSTVSMGADAASTYLARPRSNTLLRA